MISLYVYLSLTPFPSSERLLDEGQVTAVRPLLF